MKVKEIVIICALQCIEIDYDKLQFVCLIGGTRPNLGATRPPQLGRQIAVYI